MTEQAKQWQPLELIKVTAQYLAQKQITPARLDAEVLLAAILDCSRIELYAKSETVLTDTQVTAYREYVRRRVNHEPVSRILGKKEFMGMDFTVTPAVLSPRPETEILVETVLKILDPAPKKKKSEAVFTALDQKMREFIIKQTAAERGETIPAELAAMLDAKPVTAAAATPVNPDLPENPRILDFGTGSGCIAISLACLCPRAQITAVDIAPEALAVARQNAARLAAGRINFVVSDWFAALSPDAPFDIIVSNPPYIANQEGGLEPEVRNFDPATALFAGADGLDAYRKILASAGRFLRPGGWLVFETGQGQTPAVKAMILEKFPAATVEISADHAGIDRVIGAKTSR